MGEAMVIAACHYDTLMQALMRQSRGDFKSYRRMKPDKFREMRASPLSPVRRSYRDRTVSVRVPCGCSREISHRRRTVS